MSRCLPWDSPSETIWALWGGENIVRAVTVSLRGTFVSTRVLSVGVWAEQVPQCIDRDWRSVKEEEETEEFEEECSKEDGEKAPAAKRRKVPKSQSNVLLLHEDKLPLWLSYIDKPIKQQSLQKQTRGAFLCICRFGDWNFSYTATLATKTFRLLPPWRVLLKRFFEPWNCPPMISLFSQTFSLALHSTTEFFVFQQSFYWTRRFDPETRAFFGYTSKLSKQIHLYFFVALSSLNIYHTLQKAWPKKARVSGSKRRVQ